MAVLPDSTIPTVTNEVRVTKTNDPLNTVDNYLVATAVLDPTEKLPNGRIRPELLANNDWTTCVLGEPSKREKVYMRPGVKKLLQDLGRSASRKSKDGERKCRSIKLGVVNTADGLSTSAIHLIKQRTCKKLDICTLGTLTQQCNHHLVIVPARPRKEALKEILDLEDAVKQLRTELEARGETNLESEEEMYEECFAESNLDDHWYNEEEGEEEEEEATSMATGQTHSLFNRRFNDDRYPTDIEINTVLFEEIIFKDLLSKRDRLIDTLQSVQEMMGSNKRGEIEEMYILLTQDGEHAPLEVIVTKLQEFAKENKIELMKHSAGCSLIQQALDLSKGIKYTEAFNEFLTSNNIVSKFHKIIQQ